MKIAVLGDIHGNLPALEAAYTAASAWRFDRIFHLGDLGGYAPFVNEVVDFLIDRRIDGVQGNYDDAVAHDREHCGCKYEDPVQAEAAALSFAWTKRHATEQSVRFMRELPQSIRIEAPVRQAVLFHATPHKNNLYWYEDRPEKFFREMGEKAGGEVMIFGHTHRTYRRDMDGKVFINAGSVGKPKDGDARTCVTLITLSELAVRCEFLRIAYDVEKVAAAIVASGLPPLLAEHLRQGR